MATHDLLAAALRYNVSNERLDGSPFVSRREGAFITVPAIGTGIMLIHRDVFEIMLAREVAILHIAVQFSAGIDSDLLIEDVVQRIREPVWRIAELPPEVGAAIRHTGSRDHGYG